MVFLTSGKSKSTSQSQTTRGRGFHMFEHPRTGFQIVWCHVSFSKPSQIHMSDPRFISTDKISNNLCHPPGLGCNRKTKNHLDSFNKICAWFIMKTRETWNRNKKWNECVQNCNRSWNTNQITMWNPCKYENHSCGTKKKQKNKKKQKKKTEKDTEIFQRWFFSSSWPSHPI